MLIDAEESGVYKIIIVDDDIDFLSWLKFGLSKKDNFNVITAETKTEGWHLAANEKPDIVIIDLKLPDGNGFELCRQVKALNPAIGVILVTGVFRELDAWQKGSQAGADDLLIKPFSYERAVLQIINLLKRIKPTPAV